MKRKYPNRLLGEVVLFRLSGTILRPLLVTAVHEDGTVSGEVFFYHKEDRDSEYANGMFYPPSEAKRSAMIEHARFGRKVGECFERARLK